MEINADMTYDDFYRLKLSSKKLDSGKCQVKFTASVDRRQDLYGYVLVDSRHTLKDVVYRIKEKLTTIRNNRDYQHIHLFSIGRERQEDMSFIIFDR